MVRYPSGRLLGTGVLVLHGVSETPETLKGAAQAGVAAETCTASPGLLRRVLAELLQHALATFHTILAEQLPGARP